MAGLPRMADTSRPRDAWAIVVLGGVESMTNALRRGDPFSERALDDMRQLRRRLDAFGAALDERCRAAGEVVEEA